MKKFHTQIVWAPTPYVLIEVLGSGVQIRVTPDEALQLAFDMECHCQELDLDDKAEVVQVIAFFEETPANIERLLRGLYDRGELGELFQITQVLLPDATVVELASLMNNQAVVVGNVGDGYQIRKQS